MGGRAARIGLRGGRPGRCCTFSLLCLSGAEARSSIREASAGTCGEFFVAAFSALWSPVCSSVQVCKLGLRGLEPLRHFQCRALAA